ncbi:MAG: radical SAM protein [Nitrospinales bacterium]
MREIKDKNCIQIEITNACKFSCANCYKFVGHYAESHFMELETVKKAIDSLEGYQGIFGITGGEPTLHPEFAEICRYLRKKVPPDQRQLQTTGYRWRDYKSVIKKTFSDRVQYNDHKDPTQKYHPMLVAIKDVVEDQSLQRELIDKCWVKDKWSAVINSKGCFSCEISGAFDALYNGPGGHPIAKGWWSKSHENFNEQMERYCYHCGGALPQSAVTGENKKDHISISNFREIEKLRTPKFQNDRILLVSKKYSVQDIKKVSENWQPWENMGKEGHGKDILQRYGAMSNIFLRIRRSFRFSSKLFRRVEKRVGRLFWRLSEMLCSLNTLSRKVTVFLKHIASKLRLKPSTAKDTPIVKVSN